MTLEFPIVRMRFRLDFIAYFVFGGQYLKTQWNTMASVSQAKSIRPGQLHCYPVAVRIDLG
jgi:hypothetical protein